MREKREKDAGRVRTTLEGLPPGAVVRATAAACEAFPAGNREGVIGIGIGPRLVRGKKRRHQQSVRLYVRRKIHTPARPIAAIAFRYKGTTYEIIPDIVGVGAAGKGSAGPLIRFSGLHPGAQIVAGSPNRVPRSAGAVACLLGEAGGPPAFLVTAGHLFPPQSGPFPVFAALGPNAAPRQIGASVLNFLDTQPAGLRFPLDLAVVALSPEGVAMEQATVRDVRVPRLSRVMATTEVLGIDAQAYLALAHDYSPPVRTSPEVLLQAHLESRARPTYSVWRVLQTEFGITQAGDSGTALLSARDVSALAGMCIGGLGVRSSLFEPVARALPFIRSEMQTDLRVTP